MRALPETVLQHLTQVDHSDSQRAQRSQNWLCDEPKFPNQEQPRPGKVWPDEKSTTCSNLDEVQRISTKLRLSKNIETPGAHSSRLAGGHKVSRIGCDQVWNSQTHPNCKEYDLFEIGRSHLGNPGVVVGSEPRFLLQGMNLALNLRHLVV